MGSYMSTLLMQSSRSCGSVMGPHSFWMRAILNRGFVSSRRSYVELRSNCAADSSSGHLGRPAGVETRPRFQQPFARERPVWPPGKQPHRNREMTTIFEPSCFWFL
jgi:hypothetical protein